MTEEKIDVRVPLRISVICDATLHKSCALEGCRCSCHETYTSGILDSYAYAAIQNAAIQMMFSNREVKEDNVLAEVLSDEDIEFVVRFANDSALDPLPEDTVAAAVYAARLAVSKRYWSLREFDEDFFAERDRNDKFPNA